MALTHYERNKKWRKNKPGVWNAMKNRYFKRSELTAFNKKQLWTIEDCVRVMSHDCTDNQLAVQIGRSVKAIQVQRVRLKKKIKINSVIITCDGIKE